MPAGSPRFNINYTVGVDGISLLLVLLTTLDHAVVRALFLASDRQTDQGIFCLHPVDGNLHGRGVPGP